MSEYALGALPSPQDPRDFTVSMFTPVAATFPDEYIYPVSPKVTNQGSIGACVAFSLRAIVECLNFQETGQYIDYSAGFIYGNRADGDYSGEGMFPREALKNLVADGVCSLDRMPSCYNYTWCKNFIIGNPQVKHLSKIARIASYVRANTTDEIHTMLMTMGPVSMQIAVYPSFLRVGADGMVPPVAEGESITGYHQMVILGWQQGKYIVQNSWGLNWGKGGRCYIPFDYKGIAECWGVTDMVPSKAEVKLDVPMQVINGRAMLPLRQVFEPMGGKYDWGRDLDNKLWIRAVVPPSSQSTVLEIKEGSQIMKVYRE